MPYTFFSSSLCFVGSPRGGCYPCVLTDIRVEFLEDLARLGFVARSHRLLYLLLVRRQHRSVARMMSRDGVRASSFLRATSVECGARTPPLKQQSELPPPKKNRLVCDAVSTDV